MVPLRCVYVETKYGLLVPQHRFTVFTYFKLTQTFPPAPFRFWFLVRILVTFLIPAYIYVELLLEVRPLSFPRPMSKEGFIKLGNAANHDL